MSERKRRRKAPSSTNDQDTAKNAGPSKKAKLDSNGTRPTDASPGLKPITWERESDKSTWTKYSADLVGGINEAFKAGKPDVDFKDGKSEVTVIFERMVQRNKKTGWEKRIRCALVDGSVDPDEYTWEYEGAKGKWTEYSKPIVYLFEAAYMVGLSSIKFKDDKKELILDLAKKVQTTKTGRGVKNVHRIKAIDAISKVQPKAMTADKSTAIANKKVKKETEAENGDVKSFVFCGKAPVDGFCTIKDSTHVFAQGDDIWDVMLNQTNVMNNNNKFYLIQLLEDKRAKKYYVWQRWGRGCDNNI